MLKTNNYLTRRSVLKIFGGTAGAILGTPMINHGKFQIQAQNNKEVKTNDKSKPRILGGMFGLEDLGSQQGTAPPFLKGREILSIS